VALEDTLMNVIVLGTGFSNPEILNLAEGLLVDLSFFLLQEENSIKAKIPRQVNFVFIVCNLQ
jgi:hypothetical protein